MSNELNAAYLDVKVLTRFWAGKGSRPTSLATELGVAKTDRTKEFSAPRPPTFGDLRAATERRGRATTHRVLALAHYYSVPGWEDWLAYAKAKVPDLLDGWVPRTEPPTQSARLAYLGAIGATRQRIQEKLYFFGDREKWLPSVLVWDDPCPSAALDDFQFRASSFWDGYLPTLHMESP